MHVSTKHNYENNNHSRRHFLDRYTGKSAQNRITTEKIKRKNRFGRVARNVYNRILYQLAKTIELNPDYYSAYLNKGYVYSDLGMEDKAIENFKKAAELGNKKAAEELKKIDNNG